MVRLFWPGSITLLVLISILPSFVIGEPECEQLEFPEKVIVTTVEMWPYYRQTGENYGEGIIADVISRIAYLADFEYEIKVAKENKVGTKIHDGTWDGMIGELTRGESDLAMGPIALNSMKLRVVDFSIPLLRTGMVIIFKRPTSDSKVPFNDIRSLLNSGIPVGALRYGEAAEFLKVSYDSQIERLYRMIDGNNSYAESLEEGLKLVRTRNYAFIVEKDLGELVANQKPCDIVIVGKPIVENDYAIAMQIASPIKAPLDLALATMHEDGKIRNLYDKYWTKQCPQNGIYASGTTLHSTCALYGLICFIINHFI